MFAKFVLTVTFVQKNTVNTSKSQGICLTTAVGLAIGLSLSSPKHYTAAIAPAATVYI